MKQIRTLVFFFFFAAVIFVACNTSETKVAGTDTTEAGNVTLPYVASYSSDFNTDVSDADVALVLNSYKDWENGDLNALRATMGDSMTVNSANGWKFSGRTDSLMKNWQTFRDSLSSVTITMDAWTKNHSIKDSNNFVTVWYKEIDTYKTGRVDSANFSDINHVKDGKISWFSQFKQQLK